MINPITRIGAGITIGVSLTAFFAPPLKLLALGYIIGCILLVTPQLFNKIKKYFKG
ncbi:hypothetical protein GW933_01430 [Candidatus Falkowbacteria bacterium]|nr:hypothetical protein [Candidatus Falkowbacteria bacterium]